MKAADRYRAISTDDRLWSYGECVRMPELIRELMRNDPVAHQLARSIHSLDHHTTDRGEFAVLALWLFLSCDDEAVRLREALDRLVRTARQVASSPATVTDPRVEETR